MIETIPDQPVRASGKNESVKLLAGEQQGAVRPHANGVKLASVNRAPDAAGGGEVQISSSFNRRQVWRARTRYTSVFRNRGDRCTLFACSTIHLLLSLQRAIKPTGLTGASRSDPRRGLNRRALYSFRFGAATIGTMTESAIMETVLQDRFGDNFLMQKTSLTVGSSTSSWR